MITGRSNYKKYGELLGVDLINNPDLAATPAVAFRIGALFWKASVLNERADAGDFTQITKRINGGLNGLAERQKYYERAKKALGVLDSQQLR
jgi:predicted chitinase